MAWPARPGGATRYWADASHSLQIRFKPAPGRVALVICHHALDLIMEITRQSHLGLNATRQASAPSLQAPGTSGPAGPITGVQAVKPALERIQSALGQLPEVDLEKVAAIKAALAAGELATDSASLAAAMLSHHRGGER